MLKPRFWSACDSSNPRHEHIAVVVPVDLLVGAVDAPIAVSGPTELVQFLGKFFGEASFIFVWKNDTAVLKIIIDLVL